MTGRFRTSDDKTSSTVVVSGSREEGGNLSATKVLLLLRIGVREKAESQAIASSQYMEVV